MRKQSMLHKTLARALSIKRPHDTIGTKEITRWLIDHIPEGLVSHVDAAGNVHIDARLSKSNRTLFVAHVDTVHRTTGPNKIRKTDGMWYAHADAPLGADDGAGCAMLMHLLCAGVPAYYIFTQGEECGGIGASHVAANTQLLRQFDRAIAFDRRGIDSVITHQGGSRCCSDVFADALADALNADMTLMYLPDSSGVYTDTAEFVDVIPECTNLSVGYYHEHSAKESLDVHHLQTLADRCLLINWDDLPTTRDPSVVDSLWSKSYDSWGSWGTGMGLAAGKSDTSFADYYDEDALYRSDVRDALYDSEAGYHDFLIQLMCESVYPEDPDMVVRFIDTSLFTPELVNEALDWVRTYDPDTVLASLFDAVHCEA